MLVDDELSAIEGLSLLINQFCPSLHICGSTTMPQQAPQLIEEICPDIVFLDINMPRLGGFDLLRLFDKRDFYVVIITASENHALEAIKSDVSGYLLKPFVVSELIEVVCKIQEKITNQNSLLISRVRMRKIILPVLDGSRVIEIENVIMLKADGLYTIVYYKGERPFMTFMLLKNLEDSFHSNVFFRSHKSYYINLNFVLKFDTVSSQVSLIQECLAQVSRRKKFELVEKLKLFSMPFNL